MSLRNSFNFYQLLRQDFLSKQRQWELDQARAAPEVPPAPDDEMLVGELGSTEGKRCEHVPAYTS